MLNHLKFSLINGNKIPIIGLGTYKVNSISNDNVIHRVLDTALAVGYRLIDTASGYKNERDIGDALSSTLYEKHELSRKDLFITTKIAPKDMQYELAMNACKKTLEDLQTDYVDLCLIHWPGVMNIPAYDPKHSKYRKDTWHALEQMLEDGFIKNIGVSNYTIDHLKELLAMAKYPPVVNQVEFHPLLHQKDLSEYCRRNGIFLQAYSSLGTGQLTGNKEVERIAAKNSCSPAQLLLQWAVQQNIGVLPKSTNCSHISENFRLEHVNISSDDMTALNSLNQNKHYCWDPTNVK